MRHLSALLAGLFFITLLYGAEHPRFRTVVIDAGHGGKDPGAMSRNKSVCEKDLTLDISCRLAAVIKERCPEINVILTRPDDNFISLAERAEIANKNSANLFISIHINAARSTTAHGYSIHILGDSAVKDRDLFAYNMDVVKRENAVMYLEDDYTTKYSDFNSSDPSSLIFLQLLQSSNLEQSLKFAQIIADDLEGGPISTNKGIWQNPFYVLWKTSMPAVLVELGFISNDDDLSELKKIDCRTELVERLFKSFVTYKDSYNKSVNYFPQEADPSESAKSQN